LIDGCLQIFDGVLDRGDGRQGAIQLNQSVLEIRWYCDISQGVKAREVELGSLNVAKWVHFVDGVDGAFDGRVDGGGIVL